MAEVIADQNYYFDKDGNVTTDEAKGERWLAREGAAVMEEHQGALKTFQGDMGGDGAVKVTPPAEGEEDAKTVKSAKPAENKKAAPKADKGAK